MTIRGAGFDLGETLLYYRDTPLSWASLYPDALAVVASGCGVAPTQEQFSAAVSVLSSYNTRLVPRTVEACSDEILSRVLTAWELESCHHLPVATEAFFSFFQQQMCAYPDAVPVLTWLRERGIPTGILTDVPYGMPREFVERDLDGAGIAGLVDVLLTSVEVGVRKPDPAGILALADRLGIAPEEMVYVGNEPKDILSAREAGAVAVFLDREGTGADWGQRGTIGGLETIKCLIEAVNKVQNPRSKEFGWL